MYAIDVDGGALALFAIIVRVFQHLRFDIQQKVAGTQLRDGR